GLSETMSSPFTRNIHLPFFGKTWLSPRCPAFDKRDASRSSRTLGAGCDGRVGARDEAHERGRPSRVVLVPRRWDQVRGRFHGRRGLTSPVPRGERGAAVNTIAQGRPDVSAYPW